MVTRLCIALVMLAIAGADKQLYQADLTKPLALVKEDTLCGGIAGGPRKRMPTADEAWVLEAGFIPGILNRSSHTWIKNNTQGPCISFITTDAQGMTLHNNGSHLTLWNTLKFPHNSELRFGVLPHNLSGGLMIAFFGASSNDTASDRSIFALSLPPRQGNYSKYTRGAINTYSDSFFRADGQVPGICDRNPQGQCEANLRRDPGFNMLEHGVDLISYHNATKPFDVRVRRHGAELTVMVNGGVSVRYTDTQPLAGDGYYGIRSMANTGTALVTYFEVWSVDSE